MQRDTELKTVGAAVEVIGPCTDVSTEGKAHTEQSICGAFFVQVGRTLRIQQLVFVPSVAFSFIPLFELRLNATDYPLFLIDHS